MKHLLLGHTSFETAYIIEDYPYGSLRCQKAVWLETSPKKGMRVVTCTKNPKTGRWNAYKKGTYDTIKVMYINDENGHVEFDGIHEYNTIERAENFLSEYESALTKEQVDYLTRYKYANIVQEEYDIRLHRDGREAFYTKLNELLAKDGYSHLILTRKIPPSNP